jgi:hypothetical protein
VNQPGKSVHVHQQTTYAYKNLRIKIMGLSQSLNLMALFVFSGCGCVGRYLAGFTIDGGCQAPPTKNTTFQISKKLWFNVHGISSLALAEQEIPFLSLPGVVVVVLCF